MSRFPVILDARTVKTFTFLPLVSWPGRVHQGPDGTTVIITAEGSADVWPPAGHRSIASDPAARRLP
jgi:hypothetical protein